MTSYFVYRVLNRILITTKSGRSVGNENSGSANTAALDHTSASPWTARYVPVPTYPYPRVRSIAVYRYNCLIHRQVNTVDRFDSEFATGEDPYAPMGKQSGGTVFGVDALADLLGATTEDQMGSRDLNGVARGPCRTCR